MKIKTLVAMLFLSAGATTVVAQDATNCNSNSSICVGKLSDTPFLHFY